MTRRGRALGLAVVLAAACDDRAEIPIGADRCQTPGAEPFELSALGPSDRSHWLQPWRAYVDTWPAARMRGAIGLGVNDATVDAGLLPALARSGVSRAGAVIHWASASFDDPSQLDAQAAQRLAARLQAFRRNGIRPIILVYGHEGTPAPNDPFTLELAAPAPAGARTIALTPAQASRVVPGRTGLSNLTGFVAAEVLVTGVDAAGVATLSKPLPKALAAGAVAATTLKFEPWSLPTAATGGPNPRFEATLSGWIAFVRAVASVAREALGDEELDLELWNELVVGARFLDIDHYYDPPIDGTIDDGAAVIPRAIRARTVAALRPEFPRIGIGDGFANTDWSYASSTEDPGITALDRHVSVQPLAFPDDGTDGRARALDATGAPDGARGPDGSWQEPFVPSYSVLFPELPLTAILPYDARRPGQIIRDLAPLATLDERGVSHGRDLVPRGGSSAPEVWLTAVSTRPRSAPDAPAGWSRADVWRFQTKAALRTLASYVSKGASLVEFYAPADDLALVDDRDPTGGPVLPALARFRAAFDGPAVVEPRRALTLNAVRGCTSDVEVAGDGSAAHPGLVDRELVAFFPFQVTARQFVAATYVMTRDLMRERQPAAAPEARFDLAARPFELVIGGVDGRRVLVEANDPVSGLNVEVTVTSRAADRVVVSMPLTDSVRLLRLTEP